MRITTYEKGGNSLNPFIKLLIFLTIILGLFVIPVSAFDDSVQRYAINYSDLWDDYTTSTASASSSFSQVNYPAQYATSQSFYLASNANTAYPSSTSASAYIQSVDYINPDYFAFTVLNATVGSENEWLVSSRTVYYTNSTGQSLSVNLPVTSGRYEFVKSSGDIMLYVDGVYESTTAINFLGDVKVKIQVSSSKAYEYSGSTYTTLRLDDFSTSSIIGMNEDWTQASVNIDLSYGIQSMASYPEAEFSIQVKKKSTGNLVNKTIITNPSGFVCWNRNNIFTGNYGDFRAYYYKDEAIYAYTDFTITDTTAPSHVDITENLVIWDQDPYYTGEIASITTLIYDIDTFSYSYYLDLYNTQDYLTTIEITDSEVITEYTFPIDWTDTSLLAKLVRVEEPYGTNEVQLAYDISHFETLNWDTTVSFDKSSYDPGETLKVTWSGAPTGSTVWLRAMDDGEIIKPNVDYSGSFEFTVPSTTQETYYLVDVIVNGVSQVQASCAINIGNYWVDDYIYVSNYSFSDGDTYSLHNVDRAEYLNVTTETNIITDFVDVYYNNVYDDKMVSIDHIENLTGTDQVLKFPNDLGSGQYITIIYYHNVTTGTQAELSYYTNVGEKGEGIDIYNAVITMDDTKEILDIESIAGYGGNDLVVSLDRIVIFDIYADEIINSTTITQDYLYNGDANYNSTSNYHIKRSYLFNVLGLTELQFEVHNDATNTDDIIKYKVYVQGIDQTNLDGSVIMYWTKSNIELNEDVLLYFNVSDMPNNPILTIVSTGDSKYITERTLYTNQTGTESIPDYYKEFGTYTATITCNDIVYAISTLTIIDLDEDEDEDEVIPDTTFQDNTTSLLNSPYLIGLLIMAVFLAVGAASGIGGMIVTGSMGLGIICYMGIFPWILLVIEVLVVAALMAKGMINLAGD
jgi:hypothetical protein